MPEELDSSKKTIESWKELKNARGSDSIKTTFAKGYEYEVCFTSNGGSSTKHVFFEFPLQNKDAIGSKSDLGEGVTLLQSLATEIQKTGDSVKETISKTSIFDLVYDEMEKTLYSAFFLKAGILLIICGLQCWIFMKMVGKKALEYKRVSIPI